MALNKRKGTLDKKRNYIAMVKQEQHALLKREEPEAA